MGNRGNTERKKMVKQIRFVCPECGCRRAECVEVNATVTSVILSIVKEGDFNFHAPIIGDSDIDGFGCAECNFQAQNQDGELITDNKEFAQWCLDNCQQK
jgi:hypothetical protein